MNWNPSNIENLRRVFTEGFTARDIAEPLISLDAGTPASEALQLMQARDFDVLGVRRNGLVAGFLERVKLGEGTCGQHLQTFDDAVVLSDAVSLADAVVVLVQTPRLFIKTLGAVGGIITMSDIQKPPVSMWLFGDHHDYGNANFTLNRGDVPGRKLEKISFGSTAGESDGSSGGTPTSKSGCGTARLPSNIRQRANRRTERKYSELDGHGIPPADGRRRQKIGKPPQQSCAFARHSCERLGHHCRTLR